MQIKTITTVTGVNEIDFGNDDSQTTAHFYWFKNLSDSTLYVSAMPDPVAGEDNVAELSAKGAASVETDEGKVYILGAGKVEIHRTNSKFCPFELPSTGSGGGGTIDAYTKTESDAKYAQKTDIPSSLPANGGNADTVGGKSPSDFVEALTMRQTSSSRILIPDNVDVASWLVENAKIGTVYFITPKSQGQTNLPPITGPGWAWFSFNGIRYLSKVMLSDSSTRNYLLDYVNLFGGWKEISTTPIKSTTFSSNSDGTGNFILWAPSENKVPISIQFDSKTFYAVPFLYNNQMWLGSTIHEVTRQPVTNTTVSGTVYYIEV